MKTCSEFIQASSRITLGAPISTVIPEAEGHPGPVVQQGRAKEKTPAAVKREGKNPAALDDTPVNGFRLAFGGRDDSRKRGVNLRPRMALSAVLASLSLTSAVPALSQEMLDIGEVVVTPNRTPTEKSKVGSKVETVTGEEIKQQALPLVTDYLDRLPGVSVSSPGGIGTEGSLSVRGAPKRYVKTLYNGIDISDPTSTQVQTSYQHLLGANVESIEVLKGSQSTLYGSDAIAGVISVSTLGGVDLGVRHILHGEGGSFGTARGGYGFRAANEAARAAFNITGFRTDGISAAAAGTERDGYENVTADIAGEYRFNENFSVFASGLYIDAEAEFDNDSAPPTDNPFNESTSEQRAGRVGFNLDLLDGRLKNTASVQGFDIERTIHSVSAFGPFDGTWHGRRAKFDWQGSFDATEWLVLQYGADHERQNAEATDNFGTDTDNSHSLTGLWSQAIVEPVTDLILTAGLRHDIHSEFGDHTTYRGTGSYLFADTGTRLHSSVGTGFRSPSLFELFDPFSGNPDLEPEESFSFDVGVEQSFFDGRVLADVTFFMLDIDNLILFDFGSFTYQQAPGTTRTRGFEASLDWAANAWLDLGAAYTYTESHLPDGTRNIRVPRHAVVFSAAARPWEKWTLSASAKVALDTVDTGGSELDDYVLVNAKLGYRPTDTTEFYVRVENLLDQDYQTARGFDTPGLSAFAGFRAEW